MPEIKNTFLQGKMNKDLDERLIPNGQYRDALNIEVSTSDSSGVGVVKNILGNHRLETLISQGFTCVGSIANEKTNTLYWFISSYGTDAILEHDVDKDETSFVLVDKYAGTSKSVLKFSGKIITGINIIDNLLLWTDGINDPRKINIDECKKGTIDITTHTQISFDKGSFHGITVDLITGDVDGDGNSILITPGTFPFNQVEDSGERVWYESKQLDALLGLDAVKPGFDSSLASGLEHKVKHYRGNEYLGIKNIVAFNDPNPNTSTGTYFYAVDNFTDLNIIHDAWDKDDLIFGNDIAIDIEERHVTVIKPKPLSAPTVKINHSESDNQTVNIPNLFETKFPRFAYRYKYKDGEFSAFSPFTHPVFNPKYPKDTSVSNTTNIFYNKDNAYTAEEPHNKAMVNSIHSVELTDFVTPHTPEDVVEIEILCKHEESPIIYSINAIKRSHKDWHAKGNHEGLGLSLGLDKSSVGTYEAKGSIAKGKYVISTENIYAALPANQLLRPWDNVPKKALAQEVTGNRIVYGNYVQNYDLGDDTEISVSYNDRINNINSFDTHGLQHVKSQRNYQVGVVYSDKYGRETPVFTSTGGAINIPWSDNDGNLNASKSLQLSASVINNFPEWVDSLKFFIKETSNQYYNLTMDRAWVTKSTYELDDSKGHIWISFPSSDRNKVAEDDYIILKKKIGTGEEQTQAENKFKIIDIQNNAPDAIKYQLVNYGQLSQVSTNNATNALTEEIFTNADKRIDKEVDTITLSADGWKTFSNSTSGLFGGIPLEEKESPPTGPFRTTGLYISWRRLDVNGQGVSSKKYKITGGIFDTNYTLKLATPITKIDADIAHFNGNSSASLPSLHTDLVVQIEKRELKDSENFSGKFFVKISKNQVTDLIDSGNPVSILDQFQVASKIGKCWYWQDDVAALATQSASYNQSDVSNYGLTNYGGYIADHTTDPDDHIHDIQNNNIGDTDANSVEMKLTDYHTPWAGIKSVFGPTFFIDSMHMAAGQSEISNYAKYCCITWSGCTAGVDGSNEESSWSYPPLKTWLTDFGDISGLEQKLKKNSIWFDNNLISTSPLVEKDKDLFNRRVDGWVGPQQTPTRHSPSDAAIRNENHINGLEGIITTTNTHSIGPRRWLSGIVGDEQGVGSNTKIYSNDGEVGRHFMHLSFFAPGKDLHDGDWKDDSPSLFGGDSWAANLQGIWGGGVFTGGYKNKKYGTVKVHHHIMMEGNHDENNNYKPLAPRPGVGVGYDMKYRELHERQWDPTFNTNGDPDNKIRDFIRNLQPGAKFRFNKVSDINIQLNTTADGFTGVSAITMASDISDAGIIAGMLVFGEGIVDGTTVTSESGTTLNLSQNATIAAATTTLTFLPPENTDTEVYTIKKVAVKKLYNHTSWRKTYNRYLDTHGYKKRAQDILNYWSVETTALRYLDKVNSVGVSTDDTRRDELKAKIEQFGAAHNRRICYIIELDKNPTEATFNPLEATADIMTADFNQNNFCDIEFLDPVKDVLLSDLSKFPAIWELDPKKQEVDLDIYYEASGNIPVKINDKTNELFAPIGCRVEVLNSNNASSSILQSWNGSVAVFYPGFQKWGLDENGDQQEEINYSGLSLKFIKEDGSYTVAEVKEYTPSGNTLVDYETELEIKEDIGDNILSGLSWYNCFSFGNGIESNRIRDDFNTIYIANGVKASTVTQGTYEEEHRRNSLIYSGVYNSNSGTNDLNQFIAGEKITKDLNPTFGSIQKLFQRRISLIAFCEDRVVSIVSNKDTIYNADGNPQLVASNMVLGDANPFSGNYGISTNPESFAQESFRSYFTDKQRGAVLRLSKDGLTPISKNGMHDWFRDNLTQYNSLIGTYDSYKEDYNLTLSNNSFSQNLILDSFIETGGDPVSVTDVTNRILNYIPTGDTFLQVFNIYDVIDTAQVVDGNPNPFNWDAFLPASYLLTSSAVVTNHIGADPAYAIKAGELQAYMPEVLSVSAVPSTTLTYGRYATSNANANSLPSSGTYTTGTFWDPNAIKDLSWDPTKTIAEHKDLTPIRCTLTPVHYNDNNFVMRNRAGDSNTAYKYNNWGDVDLTSGRNICYPLTWKVGRGLVAEIQAHQIARGIVIAGTYDQNVSETTNGNYDWNPDNYYAYNQNFLQSHDGTGCIVFDRPSVNSYLKLSNFGETDDNGELTGDLNDEWRGHLLDRGDPEAANVKHSSFYNGDELLIEMDVIHYQTKCGGSWDVTDQNKRKAMYGRNYCQPQFEFYDGETLIDADKFAPRVISDATHGDVEITSEESHLDWQDNSGNWYYDNPNNPFRSHNFHDYINTNITSTNEGWGSGARIINNMNPFNGMMSQSGIQSNEIIWADGPTVTFTMTYDDANLYKLTAANADTYNVSSQKKKYVIAIKFQDPNQTDLTQEITPVKVVDDLTIRISNIEQGVYEGWFNNSFSKRLQRPLWTISRLKIRKIKGLISDDFEAPDEVTSVEVPAVPPVDIPAWTEINYNHFTVPTTTWTITDDAVLGTNGHPTMVIHEAQTAAVFGSNRSAVVQTGYAYNAVDPLSQGDPINYSIPEGDTIIEDSGVYSYTTEWSGTLATTPPTGTLFDRASAGNNSYTGTDVFHDNLYIEIESGDIDSATDIHHDLSNDPFEVNNWYLVDIEYDNFTPGIDPGEVLVYGVASVGGFIEGEEIDINGVGEYAGDNTIAHCKLIPTIRTEYGNSGVGDNKEVLRGIFQVAGDSYLNSNSQLNDFILRVVGCTNTIHITKIVTKKLSEQLPSFGTVADWDSSQDLAANTHSFSSNNMYFSDDKLCWQIPAISNYYENVWSQDITSPTDIYKTTWNLSFTVSKNPNTNNFSGSINGVVGVDNDGFRAMSFNDIQHEGNYMIEFELVDSPTVGNWNIYREEIGTTVNNQSPVYSDAVVEDGTLNYFAASSGNKIQFVNNSTQLVDQEYGISNIQLIPLQTSIFTGSIGSWNIVGFVPVLAYIYLDNEENRFVFNNCPITQDQEQFINLNQQLAQNIKQNEQYKISFTHGITQGEIAVYYYNNQNYGFKITGIDSNSPAEFSEIVTIGQDIWSPTQGVIHGMDYGPNGMDIAADYKNTFVVRANVPFGEEVNGYIDNLSMVKVYVSADTADKTITFNEAVNGWSSFKSFVPENGVSLSKKYFTFKNGGLWQHYIPKVNGATHYNSGGFEIKFTAEEADNYNVFYNNAGHCSIQGVLNQNPSVVKAFNTINYEGSQTYITKPNNESEITIDNALAWGNVSGDILGWKCSEIKSDLDVGSVIEFIKKEGKWFNYIKGLSVAQTLDTSKFNVQGIGVAENVTSVVFV